MSTLEVRTMRAQLRVSAAESPWNWKPTVSGPADIATTPIHLTTQGTSDE
ncbi:MULTISPECIES: hypothetical protein [unclassified Brevibacterium]|nr:hypothetical protein [Brevibacterium sp. S22]